jgi:hypothetical protein
MFISPIYTATFGMFMKKTVVDVGAAPLDVHNTEGVNQ